MEENPFKRKAGAKAKAKGNLRIKEERDISIEEKLVAEVNLDQVVKTEQEVYQAMIHGMVHGVKTKEDVHRAMKTKEYEAMKRKEAKKAKEMRNLFDHLAFMNRLTGK